MTHFLYWVTHFTHGLHFCESEEQTLFFFQWRHKIWLNLCYFENVRFITSVRGTAVLKLGHPKLFQLRARQMKYICPCIHCRTEKQIPLLVDTNTYTYTVCAGEESTREGVSLCRAQWELQCQLVQLTFMTLILLRNASIGHPSAGEALGSSPQPRQLSHRGKHFMEGLYLEVLSLYK